jgi:multidrug efflux pump subunit AcrB
VEEIRQRVRTHVLPRLRGVSGVEMVFLGREENPELVVDIDPDRLLAVGGRLDEVEALLLEATEPPVAGAVRTPHFEGIGLLEAEGWTPDRLAARPLPLAGGRAAVPLGAVATVRRMASEERLRARLDGRPAVLLTVQRSPRAHALRMAADVRRVVEEVSEARAFSRIETAILHDDSRTTAGAVRSVLVAALGGALLAMLLLVFTLRQRRHVGLVGWVVILSLSATVIVLHGMGLTLNLLTLAGLLLSVGLGLDYAIIYFDRLDRMRGADVPHIAAMAQMLGPLLGALLTTLAAVLPFLLVRGLVALLFRPLIWTVVVSGIFSFVFAVVLLPAFARAPPGDAAPGTRPDDAPPAPRWWQIAQGPYVALGGAGLVVALIWLSLRALSFEVLPRVDDGFVEARILHPTGIPFETLDALAREVEQTLAGVEGTDALFTTVGGYFREGAPSYRPGTANFMVRLDTRGGARPSQAWADDARAAVAGLGRPEVRMAVTLPRIRGVQTRLSDADLIVVLTNESGNLFELTEVEARVAERLGRIRGLTDVERLRGGVSPRWRVEPRFEALAHHGIPMRTLKQTLAYALEGRVLRQRMSAGEPLRLRARFDRGKAGGPHQLEALRLPAVSGALVHLGELADFALVEEPTHIERRENRRVVRLAAQFDPAGPGPGRVAAEVRRTLADLALPEGVSWWLEGEVEALEETRRTFLTALALALLMVLTLLVIQYGSLPFAAAALVIIPQSAAGALLLLRVMNRPLDAMVLAGLLIAVGVVANNIILVLSEACRHRAERPEAGLREALWMSVRDRLRPILLTVMSTVLGMSPLLFGGAEVFGLLQPLAISLTGALIFSIPLAGLLLPGLVLLLSPRRGNGGSTPAP